MVNVGQRRQGITNMSSVAGPLTGRELEEGLGQVVEREAFAIPVFPLGPGRQIAGVSEGRPLHLTSHEELLQRVL
jgi:hypothetical protein